jgi:hypothetical protein
MKELPTTTGRGMAYVIFILAILFGLVWACVVSRGFRITMVILALAGAAWVAIKSNEAEKQKAADHLAEKAAAESRAKRQTELWSRVPANKVELRNPEISADDPTEFSLTGSIKNLSAEQLGAFEIDVTVSDCLPNNKCEIVGQSSEVIWVDIPPQQVRGISGKVQLFDLPEPRGMLSPAFAIKRVYAGDFLDRWAN